MKKGHHETNPLVRVIELPATFGVLTPIADGRKDTQPIKNPIPVISRGFVLEKLKEDSKKNRLCLVKFITTQLGGSKVCYL